uniref:Uncharacterized protein n=1 Tax=Siphoviridae sp. ctTgb17 TaxID=2825521 RepID=A0A8S5TX10_9CAUD|nr:MAG TPA: hypothetical protein [Siphoviridae sp. ctTgb17]
MREKTSLSAILPSITICWTGAACRCGWRPRWPPVCRQTADA